MMKKSIPILVLGCIMALMLFLVACGGQVTLTTTVTSTTTTPTTITTTMTATTTSTTTMTSTTTITTTPENPFHGSISGNWTGHTVVGQAVVGTFSVNIDRDGNVTGTFEGTYTGVIAGSVDACGNLNAVGTAIINGESQEFDWLGTATLTLTTTGVEGNWNGTGASGTFIGTGTTA
jgi:hypothetical protein